MCLQQCPVCGRENHHSPAEKSRNCGGCKVPLQNGVFRPDDNITHIHTMYKWGKSLWQERESLEKQIQAKSLTSLEAVQPTTEVHSPDQTKHIAIFTQTMSQLTVQLENQLKKAEQLEHDVRTKGIEIKQRNSQVHHLSDQTERQENQLQEQANEIQNLSQLNAELTSQLKASQEEALANVSVLREIREKIDRQLKTQDSLSKDEPIAPELAALKTVLDNVDNSSEPPPPAIILEDDSAASSHVQPPWLPRYNQAPKSMSKYAVEVLATEDSLHNYWVARERQVIFEQGNGSYWIFWADETRQTGYLVPKANFRFNANNLDSVKVCFNFPDYSGSDYSNFSVTSPAIVSKINSEAQQDQPPQWQLKERGWLEFRAGNLASSEPPYETP